MKCHGIHKAAALSRLKPQNFVRLSEYHWSLSSHQLIAFLRKLRYWNNLTYMIFWVPFSSLPLHSSHVNVLVAPVPCPVSSHVSEIGVNHPLRELEFFWSRKTRPFPPQKGGREGNEIVPPQHLKKIKHPKVLPRVWLVFDLQYCIVLAAFLLYNLKLTFHLNKLIESNWAFVACNCRT